jgi:transposase
MVLSPRDARTLKRDALQELRRMGVEMVLNGEPQTVVAERLGVDRTTVVRWMMAYRAGGWDALEVKARPGRPPKLTEAQRARLREIVVSKNPRQLGFGMALWTITLVARVIESEFDVVLHVSTVSRILERMGLVPRKPIRQAFQRCSEECEHWVTTGFPEAVEEARRKQACLLFLDEAGVHANAPVGTTWAEKGTRPVVRVTGSRQRTNVISAVTPHGRLWFRCFEGNLNSKRYCEFMEALLRDMRGHIVLIQDRHPSHTSAATRRWFQEHSNRITVHFLPAYAPDLNPDEHVWSYLKGLFRRSPLAQGERLPEAVEELMENIRHDRRLVRSFFDHPAVTYVKQTLKW